MTEQILNAPAGSHRQMDASVRSHVIENTAEDLVSSSGDTVRWGTAAEDESFDYVPVSPWAPIALCLGLISLTGFLDVFGLYVAFFGIFVGVAAVVQIRAAAGGVKGTGIAIVGLTLSIACFVLGTVKMAHAYSTEVPDGFQRINFPKDIAEKQFLYIQGHRKLHPDVANLIGQKLYLKGFMWATQDTEGLTQFILLKDNGECCFGGKPKSHDYIWVKLPSFAAGGQPPLSFRSGGMTTVPLSDEEKSKLPQGHELQLTTSAYLGMVAVAGTLRADVKAGHEGPQEDFEFAPVYSMDAELVEEAWTKF
jgi:hypothetical protein